MSRAVILPLPGDPFLFSYWLRQFDRVWGDEVDKLYVYLNTFAEIEVVNYIRDLCNERPKINFQYNPAQIPHGVAIDRTLDIVEEDYVMLMEDDAFIFKKGVVSYYFKQIENGDYDIIGGRRGSCSFEILEAGRRVWGVDYEGWGDQGCNFWPNFFFCKKQTLLDTDRNFDSKQWSRGEVIADLPGFLTIGEGSAPVMGDTFVNTSLQLRAKGYKILTVPQCHSNTSDLDDAANGTGIFNDATYWFHVGSLSSGAGGVLVDDEGKRLSCRPIDEVKVPVILPSYVNCEGEKLEFERRVQFWLTGWEKADPRKLLEFHNIYGGALQRVIAQYGLSRSRIRNRQNVYSNLTKHIYD